MYGGGFIETEPKKKKKKENATSTKNSHYGPLRFDIIASRPGPIGGTEPLEWVTAPTQEPGSSLIHVVRRLHRVYAVAYRNKRGSAAPGGTVDIILHNNIDCPLRRCR